MDNPFAQYPIYLKATDIMDMLQVGKNQAYDLMYKSGAQVNLGKSKRAHRDRFVNWLLELEGKKMPA